MEKSKKVENFQSPCEGDEIDLYELFLVLKRRWKLVLFPLLLFIVISLIYLIFASPKYKSKGILEVQNFFPIYSNEKNSLSFTITSPRAIEELVNYLGELLKSPEKEKLENIFGRNLVNGLISVEARVDRRNPNLVTVEISATNPEVIGKVFEKVYDFVKGYYEKDLKNLKKEVAKYLNSLQTQIEDLEKLKEKLLKEGLYENALKVSEKIATLSERYYTTKLLLENFQGIKVVLKPVKPVEPYSPKPKWILAVSSVSGLFLGIFLAFFVEWWEESRRRYERKGS